MLLREHERMRRDVVEVDGETFERIRLYRDLTFSTKDEADDWQPPEPPEGFTTHRAPVAREIFAPRVILSAEYRRPQTTES